MEGLGVAFGPGKLHCPVGFPARTGVWGECLLPPRIFAGRAEPGKPNLDWLGIEDIVCVKQSSVALKLTNYRFVELGGVAAIEPPDRPSLACWAEGAHRDRAEGTFWEAENVVFQVAEATEGFASGRLARELRPFLATSESFVETSMTNRPVADDEVEIFGGGYFDRKSHAQ